MRYDVEVRPVIALGKRVTFDVVGLVTDCADVTTEFPLNTGVATEAEAKLLMGEYLGDIAAKAEREAGWDPNP